MRNWKQLEVIFGVGSMVTSLPLLRGLLRNGFKVLARIGMGARLQVLAMLGHALRQSRVIAQVIEGAFEVVADFRYLLSGNLRRAMNALATEGVYMLRQKQGGVNKYFLGFEDLVFRSGSRAEIKRGIGQFWKEAKGDLGSFLRQNSHKWVREISTNEDGGISRSLESN